MIRLGLCCMFRDQPIRFVTTTATAIGKIKRTDALTKLGRLCLENADSLLIALRYCADNGIGCFHVPVVERIFYPVVDAHIGSCETSQRS